MSGQPIKRAPAVYDHRPQRHPLDPFIWATAQTIKSVVSEETILFGNGDYFKQVQAKGHVMPTRKIATVVGVLFIFQMIIAIVGNALTQAFVDGDGDRAVLTIGVLLMLCSGLAVVAIGFLTYHVLKPFNKKLAMWYTESRVVEFTVSTVCGIYLLTQLQYLHNQMLWIYIPTALGGLVFTYLLFVSRVVPRSIAVLGITGYASLALGTALDFLGVLDLNAGSGMVLLAPGGVFEVLVLPVWLIAKGFRVPQMLAR
jgi:hypothetical protein